MFDVVGFDCLMWMMLTLVSWFECWNLCCFSDGFGCGIGAGVCFLVCLGVLLWLEVGLVGILCLSICDYGDLLFVFYY